MENSLKIGSAIKSFRKFNKITQPAFATKLNKALPTVKKYESDDIMIPLDTLDDICTILNVTIDQLWFLSRLNIDENLKGLIVTAFKKLDFTAEITNNGFIIIKSSIKDIPVSIAEEYTTIKHYVNDIYCQLTPLSSIIPNKIIYLSIVKYWQQDILPQIKNILIEHNQRIIYEQWTNDLEKQVAKEMQGLELLKNILISTNNQNNELQHVLSLLEQINNDIAKII